MATKSGVMRDIFLGMAERHLVWLVAALASMESVVSAVQEVLDGRLDLALLWSMAAVAMILVAFVTETVKSQGGA